MKAGEWEDIAFRLLALCGGFEKYNILEDVGISARNRRKNSQGERRAMGEEIARRGSVPNVNNEERKRLISVISTPELRKSTSSLPEEYNGVARLANQRDSVTKMISTTTAGNIVDLDVSAFDFSELRSTNLCSTEL